MEIGNGIIEAIIGEDGAELTSLKRTDGPIEYIWQGRCDAAGYNGDISGRDYISCLSAGKSYSFSYRITL